MSEFVRVRSVDAPGEYFAPRELVEAHPDRYVVTVAEAEAETNELDAPEGVQEN